MRQALRLTAMAALSLGLMLAYRARHPSVRHHSTLHQHFSVPGSPQHELGALQSPPQLATPSTEHLLSAEGQSPRGARPAAALSSVPSPPAPSQGTIKPQLKKILSDAPAAQLAPLLELALRSQQLRIFIYSFPAREAWSATNLSLSFPSCKRFQWSGDWELIERVRSSDLLVADGETADFYLVPFLSKCYFNYVARYRLHAMDSVMSQERLLASCTTPVLLFDTLALWQVVAFLHQTPWWRLRPDRHLFFFMSGAGAGIVPSWRAMIANAIFIVAEGDREASYFRPGVDVIVPGKISVPVKTNPRPLHQRGLLASFRGSLDASLRSADGSRVRQENKLRRLLSRELQGKKSVVFSGHKSKSYLQEMDNSCYCIIPRGNTPWTRRFFDAAVRGCIPAVLSDPVAFPFEQFIDYTQLSIKFPEQWFRKFIDELRAINQTAGSGLQQRLLRTWPAFVFDDGCAFDLFLMELASRVRIPGSSGRSWRGTTNSLHHFWSPTRGRFQEPTVVKVGHSWGAGAIPH
ncbi:hypothetical protein AB1Y20_016820 [Prymnesium parvum]|uniref:Exostosin GT47 domain-containing protein n=1 Tax=Prymnesium parvum TaxID=97485 RepID=A0AB34IAU6_PRYPA